MWRLTVVATVVLGLAAGCSASSSGSKSQTSGDPSGRVALFITADLRGSIEPCGCTSDPLGDLARTAELVTSTRAGGVAAVHLDAGSTLFSEVPVPPHLQTQEALKADLLVDAMAGPLHTAGVGLGRLDFGQGPAGVRPPRHAANVPAAAGVPLAAPEVVDAGGVKVGIFGVVAPDLLSPVLSPVGVTATDPVAAATAAVTALRDQGARVVVALAHMDRRGAVDLAKAVRGIDIVVIGHDAPEPDKIKDAPSRVGDAWLVQPANRGQVVTRIDITVRDASGPLADAGGQARAKAEIEELRPRLADARAELAALESNPDADPAFVSSRRQVVAEMEAQLRQLETSPVRVPDKGSYFTMEQVRIRKALACDAAVSAAKVAFDRKAGEANRAAAAGTVPPAPAPGKPGYAGIEECDMCHGEAVAFWRKTQHAGAWETLEKVGKQWSYDCIGCHVTGWDKPGGSNLAAVDSLRDVQCEVCHGPGSIHVDADGGETPKTTVLSPPESVCVACHSPEHSDTFDFTAYLRDVTGPGHGEAFRAKLGDGPTGGALRAAALKKAGAGVGAGCPK